MWWLKLPRTDVISWKFLALHLCVHLSRHLGCSIYITDVSPGKWNLSNQTCWLGLDKGTSPYSRCCWDWTYEWLNRCLIEWNGCTCWVDRSKLYKRQVAATLVLDFVIHSLSYFFKKEISVLGHYRLSWLSWKVLSQKCPHNYSPNACIGSSSTLKIENLSWPSWLAKIASA